jgi:hypothetical protein
LNTKQKILLTSAKHEVGLAKDEERPPAKLDMKTNKNTFLSALGQ